MEFADTLPAKFYRADDSYPMRASRASCCHRFRRLTMQPTSKPKSPKHQATGRRSILRGLGAVTVAAGGATLAYGATVKAAEAARLVPAKGQDAGSTLPSAAGYRLTGNIRSYYRTARY